jgi:acetyl esterase/lipase
MEIRPELIVFLPRLTFFSGRPGATSPASSVLLLTLILLAGALHAADTNDPLLRLAGTRAYHPPKDRLAITPSIEIGTGGGHPILAAIFQPRTASAKPRPAVVFIHGGAWRSGGHYNGFGAWLAEKGFVVLSVGYRLTGEAVWPAQIEDCKLAVRWLRAHAAAYGVDPDRIGVFGTSAGGHLAACVGVMADSPELEGAGGSTGVSSRVQAAAVFCGPSDFTGGWLNGGPFPDWVVALFGAEREKKPGLWRQASPALAVKPGAPPFFVAHGRDDTHVPFSQGEALARALQQAGAPVEWVPIAHAGHDFFLNASTPDSTMEPNHEVLMGRLLDFFNRTLKQKESPHP